MKYLKMMRNTFTLLLFCLSIISCKNKNDKFIENDDLALVDITEDKTVLLKKDDFGTYSFNNWNDFNLLNVRLHVAESKEFRVPVSTVGVYEEAVNNLHNSIPKWLKSEDLVKEIKDAQKKYDNLIDERFKSTTKVRKNWSELTNAFDDVRELLNEKVDNYIAE
ncbi:MAG: hypothetical protein HWD82_02340 [Flavobacteriaceae bacterium]|nr:hypothetical protein [Flavobacteriaceae bacterium]